MPALSEDWRKDKKFYPQTWPKSSKAPEGSATLAPIERVQLPPFGFFVIEGEGAPASEAFSQAVEALFALSWTVRMAPKSGLPLQGWHEFRVYPLEGLWDYNEQAKARLTHESPVEKDQLAWRIMIRQPSFIDAHSAAFVLDATAAKKKLPALARAHYLTIEDGDCVQLLHIGSYDDEPASFRHMDTWCSSQGLVRRTGYHREIYLSDARNTPPAELKTILRYGVSAR